MLMRLTQHGTPIQQIRRSNTLSRGIAQVFFEFLSHIERMHRRRFFRVALQYCTKADRSACANGGWENERDRYVLVQRPMTIRRVI